MGQLKEMFSKYKKLQDVLKNTIIRSKENGLVIDITGEMKVRDVKIENVSLLNPQNKELMENTIKICFEKGQNKAQEVAMQKTKEILGFDPNDIANMMGGLGGGMPNIPGLK